MSIQSKEKRHILFVRQFVKLINNEHNLAILRYTWAEKKLDYTTNLIGFGWSSNRKGKWIGQGRGALIYVFDSMRSWNISWLLNWNFNALISCFSDVCLWFPFVNYYLVSVVSGLPNWNEQISSMSPDSRINNQKDAKRKQIELNESNIKFFLLISS